MNFCKTKNGQYNQVKEISQYQTARIREPP